MNDDELNSELIRLMNVTAEALVKKHNLRAADGIVYCWECHNRAALMPSLHCPFCLAAKRGFRERHDDDEKEHLARVASGKLRLRDVPKDWNDPERDE